MSIPEMKVCPQCHENKPSSEFYIHKNERGVLRLSSACKHCKCKWRKIPLDPYFDPDEIWKMIPGFPDYEVSDRGRVRRATDSPNGATLAGRPLRPKTTKYGYLEVSIRNNDGIYFRRVHQLVMVAFVGPCPEGMEVNHKDTNKQNNRLGNLEYMTSLENIHHAMDNGIKVQVRGEKHGMAILTEEQAMEVISFAGKEPQWKTADRFGITQSMVCYIQVGKAWKHLPRHLQCIEIEVPIKNRYHCNTCNRDYKVRSDRTTEITCCRMGHPDIRRYYTKHHQWVTSDS